MLGKKGGMFGRGIGLSGGWWGSMGKRDSLKAKRFGRGGRGEVIGKSGKCQDSR